jgi:hypothetical protein
VAAYARRPALLQALAARAAEVELADERHGRALRCSYRVRSIAGVKV